MAKATLYRHFPTKDDLIAAYLDAANERFWAWFDAAIDTTLAPADTLTGLFDAVAALATSPACLGCTFQVTAAEFPDPSHPGHPSLSPTRTRSAPGSERSPWRPRARRPDELADGLLLVMDGAFAAARMYGPDNPGRHAGDAARAVIAAHTGARSASDPSRRGHGDVFESLDFIYTPTADVDAAAAHYRDSLGAELVFKVRAMGTTVAALRVSEDGPLVLLAGHLHGERPVLVYRVADYAEATDRSRLPASSWTSSNPSRPVRRVPSPRGPAVRRLRAHPARSDPALHRAVRPMTGPDPAN